MKEEKNRIRVLLLMHETALSGAPKHILDLMEQMLDEVELRMVTIRGGNLTERFASHGELRLMENFLDRSPVFMHRVIRKLRKALHLPNPFEKAWREYAFDWKPDLIYVNCVSSLEVPVQLPMPEAPVLFHVHDMEHSLLSMQGHAKGFFNDWPTLYLAGSTATVDSLVRSCKVDPAKVKLHFTAIPDMPELPLRPPRGEQVVIGGCSHVNWRKGLDLFVLTALELRKLIGDRARFVWLGVNDSTEAKQVKEMVKTAGLQDCVELAPPTMDAAQRFAEFDVFLMTSWQDPFPLVVLDNMMIETPVVCFRGSGGPPEQVGDTGVIVEEFSARDMALALAELCDSPERRRELGVAARKRVRENFLIEDLAKKVLQEIRLLI